MAADFVTAWNPRCGVTGDDLYAMPADRYDWPAGPSDIYSSMPTWAEINAGQGINQIIAVLRKIGVSAATVPYVVAGETIKASTFVTIRSQINTWRTANRMSAFAWATANPAVSAIIQPDIIREIRKALSVERFWLPFTEPDSYQVHRGDDPWGSEVLRSGGQPYNSWYIG